jgi:hypothetical protein
MTVMRGVRSVPGTLRRSIRATGRS